MTASSYTDTVTKRLAINTPQPAAKRIRGLSDRAIAWLFISPCIALLLAINIFPLIWTIRLSFTNFKSNLPNAPVRFVGLDNYRALLVDDPGGGQSPAVAAALGLLEIDAVLIVNADVPCVLPYDLHALLGATPLGGIGLVASADGRTNALSLPVPNLFEPLYGPRSAERFQRAARELGLEAVEVAIPNLADDVDTREDLDRLQLRAGPYTQAALEGLRLAS